MKVMTDETFGPVIPIAKVASLDEAVRLANDSRYGLGSSVFGGKAAKAIADKLRAGMTSINSVMAFAGIPALRHLSIDRRRRSQRQRGVGFNWGVS